MEERWLQQANTGQLGLQSTVLPRLGFLRQEEARGLDLPDKPCCGRELCSSEPSLVTPWVLGDSNIAFSWLDETHLTALKMPDILKSPSSRCKAFIF